VFGNTAPEGAKLPCLVFTKTSHDVAHHISGASDHAYTRYQIDCYDDTYSSAVDLALQVRNAIDGYIGTVTVDGESTRVCVTHESEVDLTEEPDDGRPMMVQRIMQTYRVSHSIALPVRA
jgi:hypothetical protein